MSAARAKRALFLPRGCLTEQGSSWFPYRAHEVEFYHPNLSPLWVADGKLLPLLSLRPEEVEADAAGIGDRHLTTTDFARIVVDLRAHGIVKDDPPGAREAWEPILHPNQYWHAAEALAAGGHPVDRDALAKLVGAPIAYADVVKTRESVSEGDKGG